MSDGHLLAEILASRDTPPNSTSATARQVTTDQHVVMSVCWAILKIKFRFQLLVFQLIIKQTFHWIKNLIFTIFICVNCSCASLSLAPRKS